LEPGFRTVRIRPQLGGLTSAKITVPTVRGPITVAAESSAKRFALTVQLPANVKGIVAVPHLGSNTFTISLDGKPVPVAASREILTVSIVGGKSHRIETTAS
jgi:alpha-L-rhamnosidase